MKYIKICNWDKFQQYKDREPKWIKVHRGILNNYEISRLSDAEFGQLVKLWLLASQRNNEIPIDMKWIQGRTQMAKPFNIEKFVSLGFIEIYSSNDGSVQNCTKVYTETETETETEQRLNKKGSLNKKQQELFDRFWSEYPKKRSKGQAERAFARLNPSEQLVETMLSTIRRAKTSEDWQKNNGQYIPYPATWLNARGWEDDYGSSPPKQPSQELRIW